MLAGIGILLIINAVIASIFSNTHVGILLTYVLGAVLLLYGIFFNSCKKMIARIQNCTFLVCGTLLIIFVVSLYLYGNTNTVTYTEDAVIVLGAGIQGEEPSENLKKRLDCAAEYYAVNPNSLIVVSGGQGPQESISEALAMERYLIALDVPKTQILKEDKATNTSENFQFSKQLLDLHFESAYTVCFITSDYHIYRAKTIAENTGFDGITHIDSATPWYMVVPNGLRECMAVVKMWIFI